jgi:nucleotide-binding universal stress UspA family protein
MRDEIRHILAPVDFSESSTKSLNYARRLATRVGARLTVIHVANPKQLEESLSGLDAVERLAGALNLPATPGSYLPSIYQHEEAEKSLHAQMQSMLDALQSTDDVAQTALVQGYPSQEIVNFAKANGVDLIVMGTHGRGPIGHLLLGSVAENVVRRATCPVLTVPLRD